MANDTRFTYPVYAVEQDNGDGAIIKRYSFVRQDGTNQIQAEGHANLVTADIMDGGLAGWITTPVGYRLAETEDGETILMEPQSTVGISCHDAVMLANGRSELGWLKAENHA